MFDDLCKFISYDENYPIYVAEHEWVTFFSEEEFYIFLQLIELSESN